MTVLCGVCFLLVRDEEDIAQVLKGVPDWKGLANRLSIGCNDIEANCAVESARGACYRRELVRRYCNTQPSEDLSKVVEGIAVELADESQASSAKAERVIG